MSAAIPACRRPSPSRGPHDLRARRRAIGQDIDALDGVQRDEIEIDAGVWLVGTATGMGPDIGREMATLAVHEHENVVGTQAAQRGLQGVAGEAAAEGLLDQRRHDLRKRGQEPGAAGHRFESLGADDPQRPGRDGVQPVARRRDPRAPAVHRRGRAQQCEQSHRP